MRAGLIHPSIIADDDRRGKRHSPIRRSCDHRLTNVAIENLSPCDIHEAVRGRGDRCPATDARVVVDLEILRDRAALVYRSCHEGAGLLFPFTAVDPGEMEHAVRRNIECIEGVLNYLIIVVDQCRWAE